MTNEEIIQAIRTEIERRKKTLHSTLFNDEYNDFLSFLSTLESEKPVSADLEEAADNHIRKVADAAGHPGWDWTTQDIAEAFIAGAKWQEDHTPLPEDTVLFNKGVEEGKRLAEEEQADLFTIVALDAAQRAKEQILKEAVGVQVVGEQRDLRLIDSTQRCLFDAKRGDWLKIIIVKED